MASVWTQVVYLFDNLQSNLLRDGLRITGVFLPLKGFLFIPPLTKEKLSCIITKALYLHYNVSRTPRPDDDSPIPVFSKRSSLVDIAGSSLLELLSSPKSDNFFCVHAVSGVFVRISSSPHHCTSWRFSVIDVAPSGYSRRSLTYTFLLCSFLLCQSKSLTWQEMMSTIER